MAGRRPKPARIKEVTGNPGKRKSRRKEPVPKKEIQPPPAHLTGWGKSAWVKVTELLDGMGVLTLADAMALERLCDIYAEILQLRNQIAAEGNTYIVQTRGGFLIKPHPAVAMLADADKRFKGYLTEFGLTPAARAKVNINAEGEEDETDGFFS